MSDVTSTVKTDVSITPKKGFSSLSKNSKNIIIIVGSLIVVTAVIAYTVWRKKNGS